MYAISIILFLSLLQQAPPVSSPIGAQKDSAQPSGHTSNSTSQTAGSASAINGLDSTQPTQSKKSNDDEGYEKCLYHAYEWATIIGVLVALGGLVIIGIQTRHTARNADALVISERAWVQVEFITNKTHYALSNSLHDPRTYIYVWPMIRNYGKTPAQVSKIVIRTHQLPKTSDPHIPPRLPDAPLYDAPQTITQIADYLVPPNLGINPIPVPIAVADIPAIYSRDVFLYLYGYAEYDRIGGKDKARTKFCYLYWVPYGHGDPQFEEEFILSAIVPRAYIEAT
jgi:hypothetical protein